MAISRRDGLELDLARRLGLPVWDDPGEEGGAGEGDRSTTGAGAACSKPREAMSSTNEGKEAID